MEMESRPASHTFFTPHQKQIAIGEELKKEAPPYLSFCFSGMDTKRGGACMLYTRHRSGDCNIYVYLFCFLDTSNTVVSRSRNEKVFHPFLIFPLTRMNVYHSPSTVSTH
jgi:hypothetical protein